jgi:Transposase DDE domain
MSDKWGSGKKGYIKIHVAVDIKTKEILALEVTDEKVQDSKMMTKLVENVLKIKPNKKKIKSLLGDAVAYDSNDNFRFLNEKKIDPIIKVKRNSAVILSRNNMIRNKEVRQQKTKEFLKWKKKKRYGHRWMAETAFSSIKRMFGEHIMATSFQNMVKEKY